MQLPGLTHLQFLVLGILLEDEHRGRRIRERLQEHGVRKSGPAFYQLMARLEDSGHVVGSYEQKILDGQIIKERRYEITASGIREWEGSRDFYLRSIRDFEERRGFADA